MSPLGILFLLAASSALLLVPRRWAALPLLAGTCYMTLGQGVDLGVFYFSVVRILILVGALRVLVRGERLAGGVVGLDCLMIAWGVWTIVSSAFHNPAKEALVNHLGIAYNALGIYFLIRCFCSSLEDIVNVVKHTGIILVPIALEMLNEQLTGRNWFAFLGSVEDVVTVRGDRLRAQGPFAHPILAGTVGAVCAPLMAGIWRRHPLAAKVGLSACIVIVLASASSGPLLSLIFSGFALFLWRYRQFTRQMRVAAVAAYILLDIVMKAPAYFLLARIDLTGSSTGWHRAALIQSSIQHLEEWWLAGTDRTVHWMPTGVQWSPNHTDITNNYIQMGVDGGLLLMFLYIATIWCSFRYVGQTLRLESSAEYTGQFFTWSFGAALFGHAATSLSVSYFDQSFLFLYLTLAGIGSIWATARSAALWPDHAPSQRNRSTTRHTPASGLEPSPGSTFMEANYAMK